MLPTRLRLSANVPEESPTPCVPAWSIVFRVIVLESIVAVLVHAPLVDRKMFPSESISRKTPFAAHGWNSDIWTRRERVMARKNGAPWTASVDSCSRVGLGECGAICPSTGNDCVIHIFLDFALFQVIVAIGSVQWSIRLK
jgi:hypothetical protein